MDRVKDFFGSMMLTELIKGMALTGKYMTDKLRMEQGLAWAVRCTDGARALAGRSEPLQDTAAVWRNFQFEFNVPAGYPHLLSLGAERWPRQHFLSRLEELVAAPCPVQSWTSRFGELAAARLAA